MMAGCRMHIIASVELSGGGRARSNRGDAMAEDKIPPDIAKMSFEDALAELQRLVKSLEKAYGEARKVGELAQDFTPKLAALDTMVFLAGLVRLSLLDRARDGVRKNVRTLIRSHVRARRA